jgi:LAGLIDADG DNA endonuclease family protein
MLDVMGIPQEIGWYLAGFADGEGSFNVSFRPRQDYPLPWKVSLCFNISQRDPVILSLFKRHLECGTMRQRQDGVWYYEVNNLQPILYNAIPFFRRFHFLSAKKKRDFAKFVDLAELFKAGRHLRREGIEEILRIRSDMNDGGNRRYADEDILGRFENPQRLHARPLASERMIQSGLHGNMQSAAEMTASDESNGMAGDSSSNITNGPKVNHS